MTHAGSFSTGCQLLFLRIIQIVTKQLPAVFILVTIYAQVFPVRAVRGIVPAVPVFMVYGQQVAGFVVELSAALGAYEPVNIQRAFPIGFGRGNVLPQSRDKLFDGFAFAGFFRPSRFVPAPV